MALTRLNSRILCSLKQLNSGLVSVKRTFLSDSFDMKVEWNERLKERLKEESETIISLDVVIDLAYPSN